MTQDPKKQRSAEAAENEASPNHPEEPVNEDATPNATEGTDQPEAAENATADGPEGAATPSSSAEEFDEFDAVDEAKGDATAPADDPLSKVFDEAMRVTSEGAATRFPAKDQKGAQQGLPANTATAGEAIAPEPEPEPAEPESADSLTSERLIAPRDRAPEGGWRRWLYQATFGRVNVGDSDAVRVRRMRETKIKGPLEGGTKFITVLSRKGGVGKTTATTLLGMALAEVREDRVAALDANPDRGTLSDRSPGSARYTARQLVQNRYLVDSFSKISQYAARKGSRLHVLASDTDPHVAEAFDDSDYRVVTDLMSKFYSIVLTDSGTGMVHSVMRGSLEKSDLVVLVSGASVDEARLASETLSWLEAHGRKDLAQKAIVVINQSAGLSRGVNVDEIESHFVSRVDSVVRLPYDPHLAEGSEVSLDRLRPATREAVMELAALVVDELRGA